jgi:hypothetical protein
MAQDAVVRKGFIPKLARKNQHAASWQRSLIKRAILRVYIMRFFSLALTQRLINALKLEDA